MTVGTLSTFTTITGGAHSDVITDQTFAGAFAADLGAGDDTFLLVNGNAHSTVTLTFGAGSDTLELDAAVNVTAATSAGITDALITIADFNAAEDQLDLSGLAGTHDVLTDPEQTAISGAATLLAALNLAAAATTAGDYTAFNYGTDMYVFVDEGTGAVDAGDGLVKITGMSVAELDAQNFIA